MVVVVVVVVVVGSAPAARLVPPAVSQLLASWTGLSVIPNYAAQTRCNAKTYLDEVNAALPGAAGFF